MLVMPWTAISVCALLLVLTIMQWFGKLPKTQSLRDSLEMLNSRGGNIAILTAVSVYFFAHSVKLFYYMLAQVQAGTLKESNAFALMSLQFMTSSAFGGAFGALLKTMTASDSTGRKTDEKIVEPVEEEK